MNWWLTQAGGVPVGPASTELVQRGIDAGKVPKDVLVCEVGGSQWRRLRDVPEFAASLRPVKNSRFDPESERTLFDPQFFPPSRPPPANDEEEKTIVDMFPPIPSEPPSS